MPNELVIARIFIGDPVYNRALKLSLGTLFTFVATTAFALPALATNPPDACAVVRKDEAATALGSRITGSKSELRGPSSNCTLSGAGTMKAVIVTTFGWSSVPEAQASFKDLVKQTAAAFSGVSAKPVAGVGDEAQQIGANVYVRKNTNAYVFQILNGLAGATSGAKTVALAKSAMAHTH